MTSQYIQINNLNFPNDPRVMTPKVINVLRSGRYERAEVSNLHRFVHEDDSIVELGSGIGYMSYFLRKEHKVKNITCVEANPVLTDFIKQFHAANGLDGIEVVNGLAMPDSQTDLDGNTMPFYVTEPFWSSSLIEPKAFQQKVDVPLFSLSKFVAQRGATTLICDIEGGEEALFQDLDIPGVDKIYLELHQSKLRGAGIYSVFESMSRLGFFYDCRTSQNAVLLFRRLSNRDRKKLDAKAGKS